MTPFTQAVDVQRSTEEMPAALWLTAGALFASRASPCRQQRLGLVVLGC